MTTMICFILDGRWIPYQCYVLGSHVDDVIVSLHASARSRAVSMLHRQRR